jgi:hypothetical protein
MRTFIFALAAVVPALCGIDQARAADQLPAFDIVRNCNAEVASIGTEAASCTKDEKDAENELAKGWSQFWRVREESLRWREQQWRRAELCRTFDLSRDV